MSDKYIRPSRLICRNDKVIIESSMFLKPEVLQQVKAKVMKEIQEEGFAILPAGFKVHVVRKDMLYLSTGKGDIECS